MVQYHPERWGTILPSGARSNGKEYHASPHKQSNLHEAGVLSLTPSLDTLNYSETRTLAIFHMKRERPQWFLYLK